MHINLKMQFTVLAVNRKHRLSLKISPGSLGQLTSDQHRIHPQDIMSLRGFMHTVYWHILPTDLIELSGQVHLLGKDIFLTKKTQLRITHAREEGG